MRFIFDGNLVINAPGFEFTRTRKRINNFFKIDKDTLRITGNEYREILGEYVVFIKHGGWFDSTFNLGGSSVSCKVDDIDSWPLNVFRSSNLINSN